VIVTQLSGGLGNQMFQYAAGRALAQHWGVPFKVDLAALLNHTPAPGLVLREFDLAIFDLQVEQATPAEVRRAKREPNLAQRAWRKLTGQPPAPPPGIYNEPHFHYDTTFAQHRPPLHLQGYWQSEKYFQAIASQIRADFTFREPVGPVAAALAGQIAAAPAPVCVNVRRGDFLTNPTHGFVGLAYYRQAVDRLAQHLGLPLQCYVFSDEPAWCAEHLDLAPHACQVVGHEYAGPKFRDYLALMIGCQHFIIPNSTFGWWAAWLCPQPGKMVVAPRQWFGQGTNNTEDLLPPDWLKL
jgi:Glycosyl transferase family 11